MASLTPITGTLGRVRAAHLLRRATFGPDRQSIDSFSAMTADQAVTSLFQNVATPAAPLDPKTGSTWLNPKATASNSEPDALLEYFKAWHFEQMRKSGNLIKERITYFYHTHIPTRWSIVQSSEAIYYQNALFRYYAYGSFKELFKKICYDNAMLVNLDGWLNDVDSPNENFAREMLELYTIGKGQQIGDGNYTTFTETDVRAAARVLSGYKNDDTFLNTDTDSGIPIGKLISNNPNEASRHDPGIKTFSPAFANKTIQPDAFSGTYATVDATFGELQELMNMIFDQTETAKAIARKIYRFFVYYEINTEIETDIITPLANNLLTTGYDIKNTLELLLKSQHFYDADNVVSSDNNIGALIKSPIDLILGMLRYFNLTLPDETSETSKLYNTVYKDGILNFLSDLGLEFYEPYDVAGYDAYYQVPSFNRYWITTLTLANRYHFAELLINGKNNGGGDLGIKLDVVKFVDNTAIVSNPADANVLVQELTQYMLAVELSTDRFNYFLNDILLDNLTTTNWSNEWGNYKSTANDTAVRIQLEKLFIAMMQSPEYQLF
jgi:uncharacterized protein (DUF1800 family)